MSTFKIALDWTPNVNHIGLYVAQELGYYHELGIDLEVVNPLTDNYELTPGKKLDLGLVDLAIAPFETVISLHTKKNTVDAVALFAILQEDLSSIASLETTRLRSPSDLDGKHYASYKARYEDHIVREMIKKDGGTGDMRISYPDKLGIWNTLLQNKADATWIFDNWEGIEAEAKHIELTKFSLADFGIPYCYSPVILAKKSTVATHTAEYTHLMKATQRGYRYAATHQAEAVEILLSHLTAYDKEHIDVARALAVTAPYLGDDATCGTMKPERVSAFLHWLVEHGLEDEKILTYSLFTNELLAQ